MDVAEPCLHPLSATDELPQESPRLFLEELGGVVLDDGFCVRNAFQIAVPIIQIQHPSKEDETLAAIVRTNTLYLVQEKSLVELDDCPLQLVQDCLQVAAAGNVVLVQEMFGEGAVLVHSGDDMGDTSKVGFRRLRRIPENLEAC
jgi:hypothetical protein